MKKTLTALLILIISLPIFALTENRKVVFSVSEEARGKAVVSIVVPRDSHIFLKSEMSIPLLLSTPKNSKIKLKNIEYPKGQLYKGDTVIKSTDSPTKAYIHFDYRNKFGSKGDKIISLRYQMCLDDSGLCLSPETITLNLDGDTVADDVEETGGITESLARSISDMSGNNNLGLALLFCFLAGIASFLLPCVYPLIPITIGYVGSQEEKNFGKTFLGALIFGGGIVFTYTVLGSLVSFLGRFVNIQFGSVAFQPPILIPLVLFFLYFTFSMFNFYEFKLPSFLHKTKDKTYKKNAGVVEKFFMGAITGLVASPCVGPVVAVILQISFINPRFGTLYMLAYAIGFSSVLVILGTFSSLLSKLPKSGGWMDIVRYVFAIFMASFSTYYLRLLFDVLSLKDFAPYLSAVVFLLIATFITIIQIKKMDAYLKEERLKSLIVIALFVAGFLLYSVIDSKINQKQLIEEEKDSISLEEARSIAQKSGKYIFIDFNAVWCENCEELFAVLQSAPVASTLKENFVFVSVDIDKNPALAEFYGVKWLPWITVIDAVGNVYYEGHSYGRYNKALAEKINNELKAIVEVKH